MPRFRFRLQILLAMREADREARRAELAAALADMRKLNHRCTELNHHLADAFQVIRGGARPGRIDVERLHNAQNYEAALRGELKLIAQQGQALAVEIDKRQRSVIAAEREVEVLEKLRDRRAEQFRQHEARAEIRQFDEVAARKPGNAVPD